MLFDSSYRARVVIAGRPNVGKSTLFNSIYGMRRTITDSTPGVTRDIIEASCRIGNFDITLVDTGGIKVDFEEEYDNVVAELAMTSLERADVILLTMENGILTPEDEDMVLKVRPFADRVLLVVNKSDTAEKDIMATEFYSLGLGDPIPVSSAHRRNIGILKDKVMRKLEILYRGVDYTQPGNSGDTQLHPEKSEYSSSPNTSQPHEHTTKGQIPDLSEDERQDSELTVALVGRPNSGKSTLSNRLTGSDRSLVSSQAGTTRDIIIGYTKHNKRPLRILDTAGIRRKSKVSENVEYYSVNRAIQAMYEADVTIILIDKKEGLAEQDKKIATQALRKGQTIVLALNKCDDEQPENLKKIMDRVRFQFPVLDWAPLVPVSALNGNGIENLLGTVCKADLQQNKRIETGELNRSVQQWMDLTPPPSNRGRPYKIKYITQVSTRPVRFIAFVNKLHGFPDTYKRFLINRIRNEFGFESIPLTLELKGAKKQ